MEEITSISNLKIKEAVKLQQKKYRIQTGLFLLEGYKPIYEAHQENVQIETVYALKENITEFEFVKDKIVVVTEAILKKISTTQSAPEAIAVAKQKTITLEEIQGKKRIAILENIKDAGNLGTLIRSAAAFSIDVLLLCGDTIDIYNPKVVRSAVGGLFKIPVIKTEIKEVKRIFPHHNFIAAVVNHKNTTLPQDIDYTKPFVIMLGSEADGLSSDAVNIANTLTTIPIAQSTESLNLSVAGSILFYISTSKTI